MMRRGVVMPEVARFVRRRRDQHRLEPELRTVKKTKAVEFPEPGAIDQLFREARRIR
jgi:hypothetical protein